MSNNSSSHPEHSKPQTSSVDASLSDTVAEVLEAANHQVNNENDILDAALTSADVELDALRQEMAQLQSDVLRERADLENQRKRVARDIENARKFANERLLGDLLPVFDSLDAGLMAAGAEPSPLRDGLELTLKQLQKVAEDNGLKIVDPVNEVFNPDHHQAISQMEVEGVESGNVAQVFQKGYLLNERLLRPALVVVAK